MKKYVFVDCFDTIIRRDCLPEEIKKMWADKTSLLLGVDGEQLYSVRKSVEIQLFSNSSQLGKSGEYNIEEVYREILERLIVSGTIKEYQEDLIKQILKFELNLEKKHQFAVEKTIRKLSKYKANGKQIILISDFYMGEEYIRKFLENLEIEELFDGIFISCDYGLNKSGGKLYDCVLDKLNAKPQDCLMIGDNSISDIKNAKEKAIDTIHVKKKNVKSMLLPAKESYEKYFKPVLSKNKKYEFSNYAFMYLTFIKKLEDKCKAEEINKLYFLSREGQFLKKLFDYYKNEQKLDIETEYLKVSRNSTFIASLDDLQTEEFNTLFRQYKDISVKDFLLSLTFSTEEINEIKESLELNDSNLNEEIKKFKDSIAFTNLKENKKFIEVYNKKRIEQKNLFKQYLKELSFDEERGTLNIVDVGWKGTMQDNIYKIFDGKLKINGFYIGLFEPGSVNLGSIKQGLLFDFVAHGQTVRNEILSYNHHHYESLLRANHSRVDNYKLENGKVSIIYEESPDEAFYKEYLQDYQNEVYETFKLLVMVLVRNEVQTKTLQNIAPYVYLKTLFHKKKSDCELISASMESFREGFGKVFEGIKTNKGLKTFYLDKLRVLKRLKKYKKSMW